MIAPAPAHRTRAHAFIESACAAAAPELRGDVRIGKEEGEGAGAGGTDAALPPPPRSPSAPSYEVTAPHSAMPRSSHRPPPVSGCSSHQPLLPLPASVNSTGGGGEQALCSQRIGTILPTRRHI